MEIKVEREITLPRQKYAIHEAYKHCVWINSNAHNIKIPTHIRIDKFKNER